MASANEGVMEDDPLQRFLDHARRSLELRLGRLVTDDEAMAWAEAIDRTCSAEFGRPPALRANRDQPRLH